MPRYCDVARISAFGVHRLMYKMLEDEIFVWAVYKLWFRPLGHLDMSFKYDLFHSFLQWMYTYIKRERHLLHLQIGRQATFNIKRTSLPFMAFDIAISSSVLLYSHNDSMNSTTP